MPEYSSEELLSCIPTWKTAQEIQEFLEKLKQEDISLLVLYRQLGLLVEGGFAISRESLRDGRKTWEFMASQKGDARKVDPVFVPIAA